MKTDQQLHFLVKLLVVLQVLRCCTSYSLYTQCSLTVSSAEATAQVLRGQLHRPGALLIHSCPEASNAHYRLLSGLTAPSLPSVCMVCVCECVCRYICSLGRESRCGDQVTEAHYSNDHLIVKERRFFSYLSYSNHEKHQTDIRYSMI